MLYEVSLCFCLLRQDYLVGNAPVVLPEMSKWRFVGTSISLEGVRKHSRRPGNRSPDWSSFSVCAGEIERSCKATNKGQVSTTKPSAKCSAGPLDLCSPVAPSHSPLLHHGPWEPWCPFLWVFWMKHEGCCWVGHLGWPQAVVLVTLLEPQQLSFWGWYPGDQRESIQD